jgi:tetratricopeptide (TPR) repeat protein
MIGPSDVHTLDQGPHGVFTQPQAASTYRHALAAWTRGDHQTTLMLLEALSTSCQSTESLSLYVRALIRQDRLLEARQCLIQSVSYHRTANDHATHLMLQAVIQAREGCLSEAEALFTQALHLKPHHTISAEIRYERALAQYLVGRHSDARAALRAIRPNSGIVYARAIALEGWLHCAAGDDQSAQAAFSLALKALDECKTADMYLRASLVRALALTVAELDHNDDDRILNAVQRVSWNKSLIREHVQTLRYIGLVHRRAGRLNDAMRLFGEAAGIQPGSAWEIIGLAECACLCLDCDGPTGAVGAAGYVAHAQRLVEQIAWPMVFGEQRTALLLLAQAFARLGDGAAAKRLVEHFGPIDSMPSRRSELDAQCHDDRLSTYMQHTLGLVQAACGDIAAGRASLSGAHRAWSRLGYRWRALEALNDLKRIDPRRRRIADDGVLNSTSDVHRQQLVATDRTPHRATGRISDVALRERCARRYNITTSMANVLQQALQGSSNKEIASDIGLSERTVKNKVLKLYGILGIKHRGMTSRAELVARCMTDTALLTPT